MCRLVTTHRNINENIALLQAVPLSIDKHRQLMASVLADQRLTELQQRGGAWLAGLTNSASGLAQKSPDCRYLKPSITTNELECWCFCGPFCCHIYLIPLQTLWLVVGNQSTQIDK